MKNTQYIGVFLTQESSNTLQYWWKHNVGDLLPDVLCHHMTISFNPHETTLEKFKNELGSFKQLKVCGFRQNELTQCVQINRDFDWLQLEDVIHNPHVTVAIDKAQSGRAKDSNLLLSDHIQGEPNLLIGDYRPGPILFGQLGLFTNDKKIVYHF